MKRASFFVLFAVIAMVSADAVTEAKKNAQIQLDMVDSVPPPARPILTEMSETTAKVATYIEQGQISESLPLWDRGKKLIKQIMPLLTNPIQQLVLDNLLRPWLNKYRRIVKSGKATENDMNVYYTEKNAVLEATNALEEGVDDDQAAINAQLEADIAKTLPSEAAKILNKLADIATEVSCLWQQTNYQAATEPFERAKKLIHQLASKLEDETLQRVVKYLLTPWIEKFCDIFESDEATKESIDTYYTAKNYILRALVKLREDQC